MRLPCCALLLLLAACAATPAAAPRLPPPGAFEASIFGEDAAGLAEAADRLCGYLASADQRRLGFELAQRARGLAPGEKRVALALARCAFFRADFEPDPQLVFAIAQAGMEAAKAAGATDKEPQASYLYALDLGLTMRQRGMEALSLLNEEIAALEAARADPGQDQGGPLRVLGMLYLLAPPWPAGAGDLELSLELLEEAARRFPSHPLNRLFYAQALQEDGKQQAATAELDAAARLARPELWGDYAARWQAEVQARR